MLLCVIIPAGLKRCVAVRDLGSSTALCNIKLNRALRTIKGRYSLSQGCGNENTALRLLIAMDCHNRSLPYERTSAHKLNISYTPEYTPSAPKTAEGVPMWVWGPYLEANSGSEGN